MRNTTRKSVVKLITAGCKQRVWLCDAQTGLPDLMCCLLEKRRTWIKQGSAVRTPGCFVEHASTCVSRKVVVCESHVRARMWVAVGRLRQLWERHKDIGAQGRNQLFISGGGQFSWTFIRWRHRACSSVVQLFRKRSQICSFRNISENDNLLVLIRPVTTVAKPTLKTF